MITISEWTKLFLAIIVCPSKIRHAVEAAERDPWCGIFQVMLSDPNYFLILSKVFDRFGYCYHLDNVISFLRFQSDTLSSFHCIFKLIEFIVRNKGNEFTCLTSVNNCQIYFDVRNATNIKLGFAWVSSALLGFIWVHLTYWHLWSVVVLRQGCYGDACG
jgi:hypothetical protein